MTLTKWSKILWSTKNVEDAITFLDPISEALDKIQSDQATTASAVETLKDLLNKFREMGSDGREWLENAKQDMLLLYLHLFFAANILHPEYLGRTLTKSELKHAGEWIKAEYPNAVSDLLDFIGDGRYKIEKEYETCGRSKPIGFMKSQMMFGYIVESICNLSVKFMLLVASSAGVERAFSTMGFIQNDYRNKLNNEKVVKLAFCMRTLRN